VQRTTVRGISRYGRNSQGVRLMNLRDDDTVSAVALVMEETADTAAQVEATVDGDGAGPSDES
jgi:DNA gyrase subunit A